MTIEGLTIIRYLLKVSNSSYTGKSLVMKSTIHKCGLACIIIVVMLVAVTIAGAGCQEEEEVPPPPAAVGIELSSTLVPDIVLDVYVYARQEGPTTVPGEIIGAQFDITAESLAMWGVATEEHFIFGGGLTLASDADASSTYDKVPSMGEIWTRLSDNMIYFAAGSGTAAENLISTISNGNFRYYDNKDALYEVSMLPDGGTTRLAAVAIARPSQTLVKLISSQVNKDTSDLLDVLIRTANLQVVTAGLYSPRQIDMTEIARSTEFDTILSELLSEIEDVLKK